VCAARPVTISPAVRLNVWLCGSYNSARESRLFPPATSTSPLGRFVAVAEPARGTAMLPTGIHWAAGTLLSGFLPRAIFPFRP